MSIIANIKARWVDFARERRIRRLRREMTAQGRAGMWLRREADEHVAEFRRLHVLLMAEDTARSFEQLQRMLRADIRRARRAGDSSGERIMQRFHDERAAARGAPRSRGDSGLTAVPALTPATSTSTGARSGW